MKNDSIQQLLERYREGTLNDSELAELNRLTHRDEVMADAERRAGGIIRRRRALAFTAAGLLLASGAVWSLLPQRQEATLVAEATVPEVVDLPTPTENQQEAIPAPAVKKSAPRKIAVQKPATLTTTTIEQIAEDETVVMCNNQCEADSVINDIWKFLTV